jgi:alkaline phosphatase
MMNGGCFLTARRELNAMPKKRMMGSMPSAFFRFRNMPAALLLAAAISISFCAHDQVDEPSSQVRNVILLIGDGMGDGQRQAARYFLNGKEGMLEMDGLPSQGWYSTRSANNTITDSAAAATAMACGIKTNNGVLGMSPDLSVVANIIEEAKRRGKAVGLITNVSLTNATPAGFGVHVPSRTMEAEIALQLLAADADVLMGGGENQFLPQGRIGCHPAQGRRTDGRDLVEEARARGYAVLCTARELSDLDPALAAKVLGLFADEAFPRPFSPSLADMSAKAIAILARDPEGFFLMIEGGQIDSACHDNQAQKMIDDVLGLDETVSVARRFAMVNPGTLVVVTADHETGGVTVTPQPDGNASRSDPFFMPDGSAFWVNWLSRGHTAADIPLNAGGPLCEWLAGNQPNTHLFEVMLEVLDMPEAFVR